MKERASAASAVAMQRGPTRTSVKRSMPQHRQWLSANLNRKPESLQKIHIKHDVDIGLAKPSDDLAQRPNTLDWYIEIHHTEIAAVSHC
jgi:hypothetical protein